MLTDIGECATGISGRGGKPDVIHNLQATIAEIGKEDSLVRRLQRPDPRQDAGLTLQ